MPKFILLLTICLLLCSCSQGQEKTFETETESTTISETASETSYGSFAEATETDTTPIIAETETTTETQTHNDEIILMPRSSDKTLEVLECRFDDSFWTEAEDEFPHKEMLAFAKEICLSDEEAQSNIESHNSNVEKNELSEKPVESVDDIDFISGGAYDFDNDGEEEFLICLNYMPSWTFGCGFLVYIDGSDYKILGNGMGAAADASVINAGEYTFLMVTTYAGAISYFQDIYSFENGMPEKVFDIGASHGYTYRNGVFYCRIKYDFKDYPLVLCTDGVFRQFGYEKISREDFEAHVNGGKEYLDFLAENDGEITDIYTYGFYSYDLYGDHTIYELTERNSVYEPRRYEIGWTTPRAFTEDFLYGEDVRAVREIS